MSRFQVTSLRISFSSFGMTRGTPSVFLGSLLREPAVGQPCPQRRTLRSVHGGSDATGLRGRACFPPPKSSSPLAADAARDQSALS